MYNNHQQKHYLTSIELQITKNLILISKRLHLSNVKLCRLSVFQLDNLSHVCTNHALQLDVYDLISIILVSVFRIHPSGPGFKFVDKAENVQ